MSERQVTEKTTKEEAVSVLLGVACSNAGSHIAPVFKRVYDEELKREHVIKVDETDVFEFIQASKSSTDLATLQQRMIALGDVPNVDPTLGSNDLTLFPSDIHGVYDMVNDVDGSFNNLPKEIQQIFGNSRAYLKALLDGSYTSILQAGLAAAQEPANDNGEVTTHE